MGSGEAPPHTGCATEQSHFTSLRRHGREQGLELDPVRLEHTAASFRASVTSATTPPRITIRVK